MSYFSNYYQTKHMLLQIKAVMEARAVNPELMLLCKNTDGSDKMPL
jgi:hypothetical protein